MLASVCYVLVRWLLVFVALCTRSREFKELEIIVLRHELAILRRRSNRPPITAVDRVFFGHGESIVVTRAVAILYRDAGDAAALASSLGRQAVDVRAPHRSSADAA